MTHVTGDRARRRLHVRNHTSGTFPHFRTIVTCLTGGEICTVTTPKRRSLPVRPHPTEENAWTAHRQPR
jgi:hypothetical protein